MEPFVWIGTSAPASALTLLTTRNSARPRLKRRRLLQLKANGQNHEDHNFSAGNPVYVGSSFGARTDPNTKHTRGATSHQHLSRSEASGSVNNAKYWSCVFRLLCGRSEG